jgi:parallel beta-helix repeat protein
VNVWDDGYPSGGNYWSDYTGVDANGDGIGDTPYIIDANNTDRYPVMHPWSSLPVHNMNTGLGYASIQEAINANETLNGHTIFVEAGTYFENVNINKSLTLIGEKRSSTIVDGNLRGTVVHVSADNVIITEFTIQNGGTEEGNGIELSSDFNFINGSIIVGNAIGIYVYKSHNNTVQNTELKNNVCGVAFDWADHNVFEENEVVNNVYGIALTDRSDYITVKENHVSLNDYGVYLEHSWHNNITGNAIANNTDTGIYVSKSCENTLSRNTITNNRNGILLSFSNFEIVSKNIVLNNYFGILLSGSSNNSIMDNEILKNYVGVFLEYTDFNESAGNTIVGNTISNNKYGVGIEECSGNTIYHNNFINNTMHAGISLPHTNTWDADYPSGGNFWSDYVGIDADGDGIGDTPYTINADNQDRYPLIVPVVWNYSMPVPIVWNGTIYHVVLTSNSTVSTFKFNEPQKQISFNVTGPINTAGYCNITIPKALLSGNPWIIFMDGEQITNYAQTQNETHTTLHLIYTHSTKTVLIQGTSVIPEFPPTMLLPLLMVATLIATVLLKKKRKTKLQLP